MKRRKGQALVEYALVWSAVFFPLTMMIIFTAQLLWTWHSVVELTRDAARYAATHCYQAGGENVVSYLRQNLPLMPDRGRFQDGGVDIEITYFQRNAETGTLEEFACDGAACSRECVPDAVRVGVANYEFLGIQSYFGLPPVSIPNFSTTIPIESAGCGPDSEDCTP
ncbi:MAG: pilus assembly protein [Acidobacteria bacterium]|nr:pilus assembly protein [Acidobacteriota bacterium]